jgi:hypothetical protein
MRKLKPPVRASFWSIEGLHVENARRLLGLAEELARITSVDTLRHPV